MQKLIKYLYRTVCMKTISIQLWDIYSLGLLPVAGFFPSQQIPLQQTICSYFTAAEVKDTDTTVIFEMKTLYASKLPQKNLERKILAETDSAESFRGWQERNK